MKKFITPLLLAALAAPVLAELSLDQRSLDAFQQDLDRAFGFAANASDPKSPAPSPAGQGEQGQPPLCADLPDCLTRVRSSLDGMLASLPAEAQRRSETYQALSEYRASVAGALGALSAGGPAADARSIHDQYIRPMSDGKEAVLSLLRVRVAQAPARAAPVGAAGQRAPIGEAAKGQVAPMSASLADARKAGSVDGLLSQTFDNQAALPSGAGPALAGGAVPAMSGGGAPPAEWMTAADFQPQSIRDRTRGMDRGGVVENLRAGAPASAPSGQPASATGSPRSSFDQALAALPVIPEGMKKGARQRLFREQEKGLSQRLAAQGAEVQPLLEEESRLKASLRQALQKGGGEAEVRGRWSRLQAYYAAHPDLAGYRQDREAHRQFLLGALRQGAVPDGFSLDPAELGLASGGRLLKATVDGREGLQQQRGGSRVFESLDGRMIRETKTDPATKEEVSATRYLDEDGRVVRETLSRGGTLSEREFDPKSGALKSVIERSADGKTVLSRAVILPGGRVEVTDVRKGLVQKGRVGPDGKVRIEGAFIEGTEHAVLMDKDGNVAGVELAYDRKTGLPDLEGLVKAGYLKPGQAGQFLERFPANWTRASAAGGESFLVSPRILFGQDGPVLVYEQPLGPRRKAQTSFGFDKESGRCVEVMKVSGGGGQDWEQVRMYEGWDPRAGRFNGVEEYRTTYVSRYEPMRGWHTAKDTAVRRSVWDAAGKRWKEVSSQTPENDSGWDIVTKNISWTFGNVPVYKQVGQGLGVVADGGKLVGYTLTGGAGELMGRVAGSENHLVYGVVSQYQAIAWADGSGGAMMSELREKMGADAFKMRREYWVERYREDMLKQEGLSPSQKASLRHAKMQVSDDDLGEYLVRGGGGEGFGGAGREFASRAANSESTAGKVGWGLAAAGTYGADFTFQSLGFNALGAGFGALGTAAKTAKGAEQLTLTGRALIWADRGAKGVQTAQGAYFNSLMLNQGIELGAAMSKGDAEKTADSLAQFAALGLMPKGKEPKPGEAGGLNARRMVTEMFTTSTLAGAWNKMVDASLPKPTGRAPKAVDAVVEAVAGAEGQGRAPSSHPLKLSLADKLIGTGAEGQGRAQRLWDATHDANARLERPIELEFKKAPAPFVDAFKLYGTHVKNGGMPTVRGKVTTLAATVIGGGARTPVESLKMTNGEITGAGGSGHSSDVGLVFAALARMTKSNKPAHEIAHPMQATLLAGAQQRGLINGPEALGILNSKGLSGYAWGGRSEAAATTVERGGSVEIVFRNLRKNALEYFKANSSTPAEAKVRYKSFMEYMKGMEGGMRAQYPDLFTNVAQSSTPNRRTGEVILGPEIE